MTVTVSDLVAARIQTTVTQTDTVTLGDQPIILIVSRVVATDTVTVSDTVAVARKFLVSPTDTVTLSDTPTVRLKSNVTANETITLGDAVSLVLRTSVSVADGLVLSDNTNVNRLSPGTINVSDAVSVGDTVVIVPRLSLNVSDAITVADAVVSRLQSSIAVADSITIADSVSLRTSLTVVDGLILGDVTALIVSAPSGGSAGDVVVTDLVRFGDNVQLRLPRLPFNVGDGLVFGDSAEIHRISPEIPPTPEVEPAPRPTPSLRLEPAPLRTPIGTVIVGDIAEWSRWYAKLVRVVNRAQEISGGGVAGSVKFAGTDSVTVVFATPQANADYKIALSVNAPEFIWVEEGTKTVNGFTLKTSTELSTATVEWIVR